ncbi:hypothetical protein T11_9769 [Trichinella zimbabwensis]|uniref:Uncharacterized protein n=1 Tax=Trichinella zimbabwensis TaxID=268475 RepID=A0A0V1H272_9BILA|nr:hypothetical protein T11_9769 [Trichinella zimbabwensis]
MDDVCVFVSSELEIPAKGESKPSYNDIVQLYKHSFMQMQYTIATVLQKINKLKCFKSTINLSFESFIFKWRVDFMSIAKIAWRKEV